MNDSYKAFAILAGIFSFYILLSIIESIEYSNISTKLQTNAFNQTNIFPESAVLDRKIELQYHDQLDKNFSSFLDHPRTKALRELHELSFVGEWDVASIEGYQLFETFIDLKKKIRMKFINEVGYWHNYQGPRKTGVQLFIIDGEYSDDRQFMVRLNDTVFQAFDIPTLSYSFKNKPVNVSEVDQLDVINVQECNLNLIMDLSEIIRDDEHTENKYRIVEGARIDLKISATNCNFAIRASLYRDTTDYDKKTINYSILLTFMAIVNLYSIAKMIKACVESPAEANKISLVSIGFITVWDTYICFSHLYLALSMESLFHFFIMPAFWYFILFSIFEVKLLMIIWRARYFDRHQSFEVIGRAAVAFYCKLYATIFVSLFFFYKFIRYNEFLICMSLYLIPQIIHNILRGGRIQFNENYMVFVIGIRGLLPLYFRGCSQNLYHLRPSLTFCCTFLLVIGAQILLIYFQSLFGAKFFIPSKFLRDKFNYLYELPDDIESGAESCDECVVCMSSLPQEPSINNVPSLHAKMLLNRLRLKKGQIMKTPCNHKFHVLCLVGWMSIKLECPTCRAQLPGLE